MKHIRQINSVGTQSYTIMDLSNWDNPIEEHPSLIQHPEIFELADCELPEYYQYVTYNENDW